MNANSKKILIQNTKKFINDDDDDDDDDDQETTRCWSQNVYGFMFMNIL
jgi:hypothetical protein